MTDIKKRPRKIFLAPGALKRARQWVGMSQAALGAEVGVAQQTINRWEARPRPEHIEHYYDGPKHRGLNRATAELLERILIDSAQAQGLDTAPLLKIFAEQS